MIVMLLGLGTAHAVAAAVFHILNHALFKAALFMIAGGIDHATGTRDLSQLGGLWRTMPATSAAALVGTAAMAGLPPLNGYISKEMMLTAAVDLHLPAAGAPLVPALAALGARLSAAYAFAFAWRAFFAPGPETSKEPHEPKPGLSMPAFVLAAACLALGLRPEVLAGSLVDAAAGAVLTGPPPSEQLALGHGFNLPFLLGMGVLPSRRCGPGSSGRRACCRTRRGCSSAPTTARWQRRTCRSTRSTTVRWSAISPSCSARSCLRASYPASENSGPARSLTTGEPMLPVTPLALIGWAILAVTAAGTVWMREERVTALVLVSVVGLMVVLAYARLSAPDLALTQAAVEIITTVLLLLAIPLLPPSDSPGGPIDETTAAPRHPRPQRRHRRRCPRLHGHDPAAPRLLPSPARADQGDHARRRQSAAGVRPTSASRAATSDSRKC